MARVEKIEDVPEFRRAREAFVYHGDDGVPHVVPVGTTVRVGHPILDRYDHLFWPADHVDIDWEER